MDLHGSKDRQSLVWLFFKDVDEQKDGELYGDCNICGVWIARGRKDTQTTEPLRKHLRTTHPKSFVKLIEAGALNGNFGMSSIVVIERGASHKQACLSGRVYSPSTFHKVDLFGFRGRDRKLENLMWNHFRYYNHEHWHGLRTSDFEFWIKTKGNPLVRHSDCSLRSFSIILSYLNKKWRLIKPSPSKMGDFSAHKFFPITEQIHKSSRVMLSATTWSIMHVQHNSRRMTHDACAEHAVCMYACLPWMLQHEAPEHVPEFMNTPSMRVKTILYYIMQTTCFCTRYFGTHDCTRACLHHGLINAIPLSTQTFSQLTSASLAIC